MPRPPLFVADLWGRRGRAIMMGSTMAKPEATNRSVPARTALALLVLGVGVWLAAAGCGRSVLDLGEVPGDEGEGGGPFACILGSECADDDNDCTAPACVDGACSFLALPAGTPCDDGGGTVCNGDGACGTCTGDEQCSDGKLCIDGLCVPPYCVDGALSGDETDVDCGGSCPPCSIGQRCAEPEDCESLFCDKGADGAGGSGGGASFGVCAPCSEAGGCPSGHYCDPEPPNFCVPKKDDGEPCQAGIECVSSHCVDEVCCATPCDGECLACNRPGTEGDCQPLPDGSDPDDECDDDSCNGAGACRCGDGIVNGDEPCDTGVDTSFCDADCTVAECGDATLNLAAAEQCDDGMATPACDDDCTIPICGDGNVNNAAGEQCDDAGQTMTCNVDCTLTSCGDGVPNINAGEQCDDAGESLSCDDDCTFVECGDGKTNVTAGEACDDFGESATCNDDCSVAQCGDGKVNETAGEECDDMNADPSDGCDQCVDKCTVRYLRIVELHLGEGDWVRIYNPTPCTVNLLGVQLRFDDSSSFDLNSNLPDYDLASGDSVYVAEAPEPGDIDAVGNIWFFPDRAGAVMLIEGAYDPNDGSNIIDAAVFEGMEVPPVLPPPASFSPAPLSGITVATQQDESYIRVDFLGEQPTFLASDWTIGPVSRPSPGP
jgi:cysteine-rich repeat protein